MSLPRVNRLSRVEFLNTRKGRNFSNQFFSGFVLSNDLKLVNRFAVVVSLRVSKKAVVRNKIRRNIYTCLLVNLKTKGVDLIIVPKRSMLNLDYDQTCTILNSNLSKILS